MKALIHRGSHEIGGTLIELTSGESRILLDAGYPLFLGGKPIERDIARKPAKELLELGVLPPISGLYSWDVPGFDGIVISHAHLDHYGLLKHVHPDIPVYLSAGTKTLIDVTQTFNKAFNISDPYPINARLFEMYKPFSIGAFTVKPYLMDHSAFDAAAFEISAEGKTVIYSGDFRGHGRKPRCLPSFIRQATKHADVLFTEGTMLSRNDELTPSEEALENDIIAELKDKTGIALVQLSSQNIDRVVTFYKAARKLGRTFAVDGYTAYVLHRLHSLGNKIPHPSYSNLAVFYPFPQGGIFGNQLDPKYAMMFHPYKITKQQVEERQNKLVMVVRPSVKSYLERCNLTGGTYFYSLWKGYRDKKEQQLFDNWLKERGIHDVYMHTSGHARVADIKLLIDGLAPKNIVPIHTLTPDALSGYSDKAVTKDDGVAFEV